MMVPKNNEINEIMRSIYQTNLKTVLHKIEVTETQLNTDLIFSQFSSTFDLHFQYEELQKFLFFLHCSKLLMNQRL